MVSPERKRAHKNIQPSPQLPIYNVQFIVLFTSSTHEQFTYLLSTPKSSQIFTTLSYENSKTEFHTTLILVWKTLKATIQVVKDSIAHHNPMHSCLALLLRIFLPIILLWTFKVGVGKCVVYKHSTDSPYVSGPDGCCVNTFQVLQFLEQSDLFFLSTKPCHEQSFHTAFS